jgi:hypothetical protein
MPDYGQPTSYLQLDSGTAVFASNGAEVGRVDHVLAAPDEDIFDGLVIDTSDGRRFVDASLVDELFENGALLKLAPDALPGLPEPSANPAALKAGPDETVPDRLEDKLRRAWDLISGNY